MIQRFRFGLPLPTDSVVQEIPVSAGPVPFLTAEEDGWAYRMAPDAIVYGLGEMPRGINKRGWHYVTNNTDEARHSEDKLSYYGAHNFLLIDGGANNDCRPEMLVQFAIMGSAYMQNVMQVEKPRVALLNVGAEETKGRELELESYVQLSQAPVNFIGNIEARELPAGAADVVVTDGFTGNVALKLYEGMGKFMAHQMKGNLFAGAAGKLAALLILPKIKALTKKMDYKAVGGAVMLGVQKPVIKAHGSSDGTAFFNAIRQARDCVAGNVVQTIAENTGRPVKK